MEYYKRGIIILIFFVLFLDVSFAGNCPCVQFDNSCPCQASDGSWDFEWIAQDLASGGNLDAYPVDDDFIKSAAEQDDPSVFQVIPADKLSTEDIKNYRDKIGEEQKKQFTPEQFQAYEQAGTEAGESTDLTDMDPETVSEALQDMGYPEVDFDFTNWDMEWDAGVIIWHTRPLTSLDLNTFNNYDQLTFLPTGHILINNDLALSGAQNLRRDNDTIIADSIAQGNNIMDVNIKNTNLNFNSSFDDINNATFGEQLYTFDNAGSILITKNDYEDTTSYIITDANGVIFNGINLSTNHADSIIIGNHVLATNSDEVLIPFNINYTMFDFTASISEYEDIQVKSSDFVKIGQREFYDIVDSRFVFNDDKIIFANITSTKDNEHFYFDNPITEDIDIKTTLDRNEYFEYTNYNGSLILLILFFIFIFYQSLWCTTNRLRPATHRFCV
ncbi:hypothetical protein ACFL43_04085 [Thermodesulfobacteriota bacterium]